MLVSISAATIDKKPGKGEDFGWPAYVKGFQSRDIDAIDLADLICKGHGFGPVYSGTPHRERFVMSQVIAVDFDGGDEGSSLPSLLSHPFIMAYAAIIYPTLSHTAEAPRHRVVFVLDEPIKGAEGFEYAARTITELFPHADQGCANAARTFFGNGRIYPEKLTVYYEETVLPLDHLRVLARQRMKEQKIEAAHQAKQQVSRGNAAPLQGEAPPLLELMDKLRRVDAYAFGYEEWVRIGAALARTYGDAAFMPFKSWSDRDGHQPLTFAKWKSFASPHHNPAGIGTVIMELRKRNVA